MHINSLFEAMAVWKNAAQQMLPQSRGQTPMVEKRARMPWSLKGTQPIQNQLIHDWWSRLVVYYPSTAILQWNATYVKLLNKNPNQWITYLPFTKWTCSSTAWKFILAMLWKGMGDIWASCDYIRQQRAKYPTVKCLMQEISTKKWWKSPRGNSTSLKLT